MVNRLNTATYRQIVILTGAGVSAASGLGTFRGPGGLWEEFDVEAHASVGALHKNPLLVWKLISYLRRTGKTAKPNPGHKAIASLEKYLSDAQSLTIITQNVDGLHQSAGSRRVIELHGRLNRTRCTNPRCVLQPFEDWRLYETEVPSCQECGTALRPDVVLFGEKIPMDAYYSSETAVRKCDLFLAVGTSCEVYPASGFVYEAKDRGARTILVNLEPPNDEISPFDEVYLGRAEELLPTLLGSSE